jgi:WD40 repeat protein
VVDDLDATAMLDSLPRTRTRRRLAVLAPLAAAAVVVAAVLTAAPGDRAATPTGPAPSAPTSATTSTGHANGPLFGGGSRYLRFPRGAYVPPLTEGSSPTWSPDGSQVAVLADGGILVTDVENAATRTVRCDDCVEIAWSPDGRTFAAVGTGAAVPPLRLVDAKTGRASSVALRDVAAVRSVSWSPDSRTLAFLATAPQSEQGGWTVRTDGSKQTQFLAVLTDFPAEQSGYSGALWARWSPTSASIAVLFATADGPGHHAPGGPYRLDLQTMHPDGASPNHLAYVGHCACAGFVPNLVWSPDGTTVATFSEHGSPRLDHGTLARLDGDGNTVVVQFVPGSGPLSWQPLPRLP